MITNDFDVIMNKKADARVRNSIINKYKTEAVYYAVIDQVMKRYGIAPPPPDQGEGPDRNGGRRNRAPVDGRDIANLDPDALGCARDQIAMRLSDLHRRTGGSRGVDYIKITARGESRRDSGGTPYEDITGVAGDAPDGSLTAESLERIAADALMNCEALYQAVQTHLASETLRHVKMTDEELATSTDEEMVRMLDASDPGSVMGAVRPIIAEMTSDGSDAAYGPYSMFARIKNNKIGRVYKDRLADEDDIVVNAAGYAALKKYKNEISTELIRLGSEKAPKKSILGPVSGNAEYADYRSPEKEPGFSDVTAPMIKISPLMPEAQALRSAGAFENAFRNNGLLMFDGHKNMIVAAPSDYGEYAGESDEFFVPQDGDAIVLGRSAAAATPYIAYKSRAAGTDDTGYYTEASVSAAEKTPAEEISGHLYDGLNMKYTARMIEILERYSQRRLGKDDTDIVKSMFGRKGSDGTIFGNDIGEAERNADAYFGYIEHVCSESRKRISAHEFEIHLEPSRGKSFAPILYMTGERTDSYATAKSSGARFIAVYPYTDYSHDDLTNADVLAMTGDVELPSRDGYRIANADAHNLTRVIEGGALDPVQPDDNPYFHGPVTAEMAAEMTKAFDAYVLGDTAHAKSIELRKVSRPGNTDASFDAAAFVDDNGGILYGDILKRLIDDMNTTRKTQRAMFVGKADENNARFRSALEKLAADYPGANGDVAAAVALQLNSSASPEEARDKIAEKLSTYAMQAVRDSLDDDRNNFTVQRHIFMNYASAYADACMQIATGEREGDISDLSDIVRDDIDGSRGLRKRKILNDSLNELFGHGYGRPGQQKYVIKANMCKYMSTRISSGDDYDKLLSMLSHWDKASYEPDKLKHINGRNAPGAEVTIQLFSSAAYDAARAGEQAEDDANDEYSGAGSDYGASFDDEIWYAGTFAKISDGDLSYDKINDRDDPAMAIFRATHPLQAAALEKAAGIVSSREESVDGSRLKITPNGIIYYKSEDGDGTEFKIGPVLDEKAYIKPIVRRLPDDASEEDKSRATEADMPLLDENGGEIYDDNGIALSEKTWVAIDHEIRVDEDGNLENPVAFGPLDTERLIGGNGAMNRFYGISAKISDYDGYGHDRKDYAERAEYSTYGAGVLDTVGRQLSEYYIARNTIEGAGASAHNAKMAQAAAYYEIGGGTLMKCYRTNTYILGNKTTCRLADAYMSEYLDAMREAISLVPDNTDESPAKAFYDAVRRGDMAEIDRLRGSVRGADIQENHEIGKICYEIDRMYGELHPDSRNDPKAREKYRQNANLVASQAEMNRNRVIMAKGTLDQNIGLKVQSDNLQQAMTDAIRGGIDRKSMRQTDGLSMRVAIFKSNGSFDPEFSATAKQLGAVAFLRDDIKINRLTGEIVKNDGKARCVLAAKGTQDFATGAIDCRYVAYPDGKALDRSQLSMNALEKGLAYTRPVMAMISAWYNMEDGYVISKRAAENLGHFDEAGRYAAAKPFDKIGDSESGNKGIISKIVDTDIEDERELKIAMAEEYIRNRRANGKSVARGESDEELESLLRDYDARFNAYGDERPEPGNEDVARAADTLEKNLQALYGAAYFYMAEATNGRNDAVSLEFQARHAEAGELDAAGRAEFMRRFISEQRAKGSGRRANGGLEALLDGSSSILVEQFEKNDGTSEPYDPNMPFKDREAMALAQYEAAEKASAGTGDILERIADHMTKNKIQPWTGHYEQESFLWKLFRDNPDLDVVTTDACVNTRSNPSLLMYISDSEDNELVIGDKTYKNAKGTITAYLDSHLGDEKNVDYTGNSNKAGRGIGAQEMYMMNAKNADGAFMKWIMLNDPALPKNILRYNRKLMMNGFVADMNDGLRYKYLKDVLDGAELNDALDPGSGGEQENPGKGAERPLAYASEAIKGAAFIDMEELARPIAESIINGNPVSEIKAAVEELGKNLNMTAVFRVADGLPVSRIATSVSSRAVGRNETIGGKDSRNEKRENANENMSGEDRARTLFASAFGASGGNFMLLPEGISDIRPSVAHKDRPRKQDPAETAGRPLAINGDDGSGRSPDGFDILGKYGGNGGYEPSDGEKGMFRVDAYADVKAGEATRRAVPLFMSSYESVDDDTETVTSRTDDRLQLAVFKCALGCAIVDAIEKANGPVGEDSEEYRKELADACKNTRSALSAEIISRYGSMSDERNKTLSLAHKMPHQLKKKLYRMSLPSSLTCVWCGDPNIEIDEAGLSFESAKKLGYLRPKRGVPNRDLIPDDYEHMHLRYEPVGPNDFVWVNRSPGQTTGCARMFRLRITGQSGSGLRIHPAVATIFDGDFDGDTVGVANPMRIRKGSALSRYVDELKKEGRDFKQEVIDEIKSSMTMGANLVKTADYIDIPVAASKTVQAYPLFIAANADVAIACENMEKAGIDIKKEIERVTVMANIAEQAKQILNDGTKGSGKSRQILGADADEIRSMRRDLIKGYAKYIEGDAGGWGYEDAEKIAAAACEADFGESTDIGGDAARDAISKLESRCLGRLRKAYSDMEGYVSKSPCFTRGDSDLDMICNRIEDANINKKGKDPQLNALMLFGGMHSGCVRKYPEMIAENGGTAYGLEIMKDSDGKYRPAATEFTQGPDGKISEKKRFGILKHDAEGRLQIYDPGTGNELPDGEAVVNKMEASMKLDNTRARSDTPPSHYRSETELNASAQACKSDATGIGGAVAQKFQMMLSTYGYGELGLRISGPITQKYLDAKQNVTMCAKNLKIGKAALDSVVKFQYVREFGPEYNKKDEASGNAPEPGQVYNGHFTTDPGRRLTIGEGVAQLDNLLAAIGQPRLTPIDKKIISSCVHKMQADYDDYIGAEHPKGASREAGYSDEKLRYDMKDMYSAVGDVSYADMYTVKDGMHARRIADRADLNAKLAKDGRGVEMNTVFSPDLDGMAKELSDISGTKKFAEEHERRHGIQDTDTSAGRGEPGPENRGAGKDAEAPGPEIPATAPSRKSGQAAEAAPDIEGEEEGVDSISL